MINRLQSIFIAATLKGSKTRVLSVLALFVLVVVLTAAAFPSDTQSSPQSKVIYYACVNNTSGAITIVSQSTKCPTGSHKIQWNQQGPIGPQGPQGVQGVQGPTGPQGPQGPSGVSLGYYSANGSVNLGSTTPVSVVTTPALAAGTYIVTATEVAIINPNDYVSCIVGSVGGSGGHIYVVSGPASLNEYATLTATDSVTVSAGDLIALYCNDFNNNPNTSSFNAGISVIQLTSVQSDLNLHQSVRPHSPKPLSHH